MTLQPIKIFNNSLGGSPLWQSGAYTTPSRKRSKKGAQYLKKREIKEETKILKKHLAEEGADEDAYLHKAFV